MSYHRILLKISGEALENKKNGTLYDPAVLDDLLAVIEEIRKRKIGLGIVVGGGNVWRGREAPALGLEKASGDYMGMLATIMNGIALQSYFSSHASLPVHVLSALPFPNCVETYSRRLGLSYLDQGDVLIFAGGTGNPFFTTDSAAALRARELGMDAILMGKNGVDGVFDSDPRKNPNAKFIPDATYEEILSRDLGVMDQTALGLLEGSDIEVRVFNMDPASNALKVLSGAKIGTRIHSSKAR